MLVTQKNPGNYHSHEALELFMRLLEAPSPLGREERLARIVTSIIEELGFPCEKDGAGNLTVRLDGLLRVDRQGGLYPVKIGEGPVDIVGDADTHVLTWRDVYVITGTSPGRLEELGIRVGSSVVPSRFRCGPFVFGEGNDPLVAAWTFDDRMGIVTLLRLLAAVKKENILPSRQTLICFTVHEEGGCLRCHKSI